MLRDLFSLFPAYAGVIPINQLRQAFAVPFPRICGGDPLTLNYKDMQDFFSPHMRG